MVRFTDKAREFWLQQALDHGEMPKREQRETITLGGVTFNVADFPLTFDFGPDFVSHGISHRYMKVMITK